jgi:sugar lactone lactonase YvrE
MAGSGFQLYVTFSGEALKTATGGAPAGDTAPIAHVRGYDSTGKKHGHVTPDYAELRGMALDAGGQLYVAVAKKSGSAIDVFSARIGSDGFSRTFERTVVSPASSTALAHPYAVAIAPGGALFQSSQDTNVVAGYALVSIDAVVGTAPPLPVASYLTQTFPSGGTFYPGTYVASAQPVTVGSETPPAVSPAKGGLTMTGFGTVPAGTDDAAKAPARHSVRGILFAGDALYVADEGGARVGIYDAATGALRTSLTVTTDGKWTLKTPVGLALDPSSGHIYIGDPGNDAIFSYHPKSQKFEFVVDEKTGGDGLKKISGLAVAPDGTLFFASREAQAIFTLDAKGNVAPFVTGLTDTPECLLIVPV